MIERCKKYSILVNEKQLVGNKSDSEQKGMHEVHCIFLLCKWSVYFSLVSALDHCIVKRIGYYNLFI